MSHKSTIKMKINDHSALLKTLNALGLKYQVAKEGEELSTVSRYGAHAQGKVDILLTEDCKGNNAKAIGFKKQADGTYEAIGDFYEVRCQTKQGVRIDSGSFKDAISKRYTYEKAVSELQNAGYAMQSDVVDWNAQELNWSMINQY